MIKTLLVVVVMVLIAGFVITQQNNTSTTSSGDRSDAISSEVDTNSSEIMATTESVVTADSDKTLDLSGQGLQKTPTHVFNQIKLQELDLSNNKLDGSLQAEIRHLQNLKVLDLSNNQFTGVPAEIGQLKNLEVLNLSNNELTGLPYELGNLTNLKVLNLTGNNYSEADLGVIQQKLPATTKVQVD